MSRKAAQPPDPDLERAEQLAEAVTEALRGMSSLALIEAETRASGERKKASRAARRALDREREATERHQVALALMMLKLDADFVGWSEGGTLIRRSPGDPTGQQAAIRAVLDESDGPLTAHEICDLLERRTGWRPTLAAVQNMLSRMARSDPPTAARARRGAYVKVTTRLPRDETTDS